MPTTPGTYFASLTVYDDGEDNIGETVLPIVILPALSDFVFLTQFLNNGEVGTPYCDLLRGGERRRPRSTSAPRACRRGSRSIRSPAASAARRPSTGTFLVSISASDGVNTITTNLSRRDRAGRGEQLPLEPLRAARRDRERESTTASPRSRSPPRRAEGGHLLGAGPADRHHLRRELRRAQRHAHEVGEYPIVLTATDAGSSETLTLSLVFVVLPAGGGDVSQISVNFWVTKESLKLASRTAASRGASRRSTTPTAARATASIRRPTPSRPQLGDRERSSVDPGEFVGTDQQMSLPEPRAASCRARGQLDAGQADPLLADRQRHAHRDRPRRAGADGHDRRSQLSPAALVRREGRLQAGARLRAHRLRAEQGLAHGGGPGLDSREALAAALGPRASLRGRRQHAAHPASSTARPCCFDRDFTALGGVATHGIDSKTGKPTIAFRTLSDLALTDRIALSYSSSKGAIKLALSGLDLGGHHGRRGAPDVRAHDRDARSTPRP